MEADKARWARLGAGGAEPAADLCLLGTSPEAPAPHVADGRREHLS
jgi:hypothetical protein